MLRMSRKLQFLMLVIVGIVFLAIAVYYKQIEQILAYI